MLWSLVEPLCAAKPHCLLADSYISKFCISVAVRVVLKCGFVPIHQDNHITFFCRRAYHNIASGSKSDRERICLYCPVRRSLYSPLFVLLTNSNNSSAVALVIHCSNWCTHRWYAALVKIIFLCHNNCGAGIYSTGKFYWKSKRLGRCTSPLFLFAAAHPVKRVRAVTVRRNSEVIYTYCCHAAIWLPPAISCTKS